MMTCQVYTLILCHYIVCTCFHSAQVAALVLPNDGECHLQTVELVYEGTFLQYFRDPEQVLYKLDINGIQ